MYTCSADDIACVTVSLWSGEQSDSDFEAGISQLQKLDRLATSRGMVGIMFSVVESNYKPPPAIWRQRMSEVNRELSCSHYYFALITQSLLVRGVFTAVRWLVGPRQGHHSGAFRNFDEAADWIRKSTGSPYPQLETLYKRTLAAAGQS
jgi:hypothetical protein